MDNDEFYGAINYLSDLSKKQKKTTNDALYRQQLHNRTVKNFSNQNQPFVSVDLPPELEVPFIKESLLPPTTMNINYDIKDDIPYGCLKNGIKPSYRSWVQTRKRYDNPIEEALNNGRPPTPPKKNGTSFSSIPSMNHNPNSSSSNPIQSSSASLISNINKSREERLEIIKNKLKNLENEKILEKLKEKNDVISPSTIFENLPSLEEKEESSIDINELLKTREEQIEKSIPKNTFKKTIRRKFTLGKSDKLRKVAILIKDKQTRKNVINAQKELKKTNITDVRKYLRQHGMIKTGSTCPNDILRKTFEFALMAGEVTNTNKDILLHNFLNDSTTV